MASDSFAYWHAYLKVLNDGGLDYESYFRRLQDLTKSLFSTVIDIAVVDFQDTVSASAKLQTPQEVEKLLAQPSPQSRIISLCKEHSLAKFRLDQISLLQILTKHKIDSCFLDLLFGFRAVDEILEKGYGLWVAHCNTPTAMSKNILHAPSFVSALIDEALCYQLRYFELNYRGGSNRWSERQVGVYHQLHSGENASILLHATPNSRLQSRIMSMSNVPSTRTHECPKGGLLDLHILVFSTYLDEWRWYLNDVGTTCKDLQNRGFITQLDSQDNRSLNFSTLQEVRSIESKILTALAILQATVETLDAISRTASELGNDRICPDERATSRTFCLNKSKEDFALQKLRRKTIAYLSSVHVLQRKTEKLSEMLTDGTNQKAQAFASKISRSLLGLTEKSVDDNITIRVITVITLIYLPTQFVATFFGTNFVRYQDTKGTIQFAQDFWIFLAVAVPLTLTTLATWLISIQWRRRSRQRTSLGAIGDLEKIL